MENRNSGTVARRQVTSLVIIAYTVNVPAVTIEPVNAVVKLLIRWFWPLSSPVE